MITVGAALATVTSAFVTLPVSKAPIAQPRCSVRAILGVQQGENWPHARIHDEEASAKDGKVTAGGVIGAIVGVGSSSIAGAELSSALSDSTLAMFNHGSADFNVPQYMDMLLSWVDTVNGLLPTTGQVVYATVLSVDTIAFASIVYLAYLNIVAEKEGDGMLHRAQKEPELRAEGEACIVSGAHAGECGALSFDSTEGYACVEVVGKDGTWRWVCDDEVNLAHMMYAA